MRVIKGKREGMEKDIRGRDNREGEKEVGEREMGEAERDGALSSSESLSKCLQQPELDHTAVRSQEILLAAHVGARDLTM